MKILIIDDNKAPAEHLGLEISLVIADAEIILHHTFMDAFEAIERHAPDAVVLDLFVGPDQENQGDQVSDRMWREHFFPLVIYSANPQPHHHELAAGHAFIKCCTKIGSESVAEVVSNLAGFKPLVMTMRKVRRDAMIATNNSLRHICPVIWKGEADETKRAKIIDRMTRRRVAASMDENLAPGELLSPFEQYIYPPIAADLLMGDILFETAKDKNSAGSYCVVITPSCDLVQGRPGCAKQILVCRCEELQAFLKAAQLLGAKAETLRAKLKGPLTREQVDGFLCLPELPTVSPMLAVNLKHHEIIPVSEIALDTTPAKFNRVASVDSPFRERISWAFGQITGRPGLPDVDIAAMIEEFISRVPGPTAPTPSTSPG